MREPDWMSVFYEVPGGIVRCIGKRRSGQTGALWDCGVDLHGDYCFLIKWDKDGRLSWKHESVLESADPRFPMPKEQQP